MSASAHLRPTRLTRFAITAILATIAFTAAFLVARYPALPDILPVRFNRAHAASGWQWKTYVRVLMPVLVQATLGLIFGVVAALLLSRPPSARAAQSDEIGAATAAAEAISLFALIWIAFQAYAALALVMMWQKGRGGLGASYTWLMLAAALLSLVVARRASARLGRPAPRAYVAEHWCFRELYRNPSDPALFVPTRDGLHWTLNFGRPVAAVLMALTLGAGILGPAIILRLLLR